MLYIIDGTGEHKDEDYALQMAGSFCGQLKFLVQGSHYVRGPSGSNLTGESG